MGQYDSFVDQLATEGSATPEAGAYDEAVDALRGQSTARAATLVGLSIDANADRAATNRVIARRYNTTPEVVDKHSDEFRQRAATESARAILDKAPRLRDHLNEDPDLARVLHRELPQMAQLEQAAQGPVLRADNPSYGQRLNDWWENLFGIPARQRAQAMNALAAQDANVSLGQAREALGGMDESLTQGAGKFANLASFGLVPDAAGDPQTASGAVGAAAGGLAGFLAGPYKLASAMLLSRLGKAATFEAAAGDSFAKAFAKTVANGAVTQGLAGGLASIIPALNSPDVPTALARIGADTLHASEMGAVFGAVQRAFPDATLAQYLARTASLNAGLPGTGESALDTTEHWDELTPVQQADRLTQHLMNAFFAMHGAGRTGGGWLHDAARADLAIEDYQRLQVLGQVSAASQYREADPEGFKRLIAHMTEDGDLETVYVDVNTFAQAMNDGGVTPEELQQKMPAVAAQLLEAAHTDGLLRISAADYATHIAGSKMDATLLDHLKVDPEGKTFAEAEAFHQTQLDELAKEAKALTEKQVARKQFERERKDIYDSVKASLDALPAPAGRPRAENAMYAALHRDIATVLAARLGVTPAEAHAKYGASIRASTGMGERFEQPFGGHEVAATPLAEGASTLEVDGTARPTLDSTGRPIHWSEEGVRNFWRAFGDTPLVDAEGRPLRVFHGSSRWSKDGIEFGDVESFDQIGTWFADRPDEQGAGQFAYDVMYPVYLAIKNPWVPRDGFKSLKRIAAKLSGVDPDNITGPLDPEPLRQWLKDNGYDGIQFPRGTVDGLDTMVYVALDPEQIKSATGNNGNFDLSDPNILHQQSAIEDDALDNASDDAPPETTDQADVPTSVDEAASLANALRVATTSIWRKGRDLKVAIQDAVQAAARAAGVDVSTDSPQSAAYLTRVGTRDALDALKQNPNAVGWYDLKTRQALAVMSLVHPELATDPDARLAFVWIMAVTSNGLKVGKNFELTETTYARYKQEGRMPTDVGVGNARKDINKKLALFDTLKQSWGAENLRKFMLTPFLVKEIISLARAIKPGGEHADVEVRGAAILGPKIGNGFFSNLYGNFDALTMDRWLIRTWGRWTGTLIKEQPQHTEAARGRVREVLRRIAASPEEQARLSAILSHELASGGEIDALARAVQKASMKPELREQMNATDVGSELRLAGNGLAKYLDGQKEAPSGPWERKQIRRVFTGILEQLRAEPGFANLTMADLQAVLWYAEKRLYEAAKVDLSAEDEVEGYEDDEAPDYANAAVDVARAAGISERKIQNALKREQSDGRTATARPGTGSQPGDAGPDGEPGKTGGFTRQEKSHFRATVAVHRIRRIRSNLAGDEASSWSYQGDSRENGGRLRVLKKLGIKYTEIWKAGPSLARTLASNGQRSPAFYELTPDSADKFHAAISAAKRTAKFGAAVYVYPLDEYRGMRLFLSDDGKAGVAIKPDGDIVSVFGGGGTAHATMDLAVMLGGRKLDAFDTVLPNIYAVHGFVPAARLAWDDSQAPEGWSKDAFAEFNKGEPAVLFMAHDPDSYAPYAPGTGSKVATYAGALRVQNALLRRIGLLHQSAYHGSPHRGIDKFSTDHIGTGEGAQVYGWGLYFASKRAIAEYYRRTLTDANGGPARMDYNGLIHGRRDTVAQVVEAYQRFIEKETAALEKAADPVEKTRLEKTIAALKSRMQKVENQGQLYEADIPDDHEMLDWDKPPAEQTPEIQQAMRAVAAQYGLIDPVESGRSVMAFITDLGHANAAGSPAEASRALRAAGIKGTKYLDADSRTGGEGSHNYVVFSDDDVAIRNQFYQNPESRGTYRPGAREITMLKDTDFSTFLHETGHYLLHVYMDIARQADAPAEIRADMQALLGWFGVESIDAWHAMSIDEQRGFHEQFARGFEAYLFEGKAPNLQMRGLFRRVRELLKQVYQSISALGVTLTPEVRQVMDRMLATDKAIADAEAARVFEPLQERPEGVSDEDWANYQALHREATEEATEALLTRSLKDMQWLSGAKSKALRALQRQAARARAEVRAQVTAEVNAMPVYLAERWLAKGETVSPSGEQVKLDAAARAGAKLNSAAVRAMYPDSMLAKPDLDALRGMMGPQGMDPQIAAEMFGFGTADDLIRALASREPRDSVIEGMTDQRMLENHSELATPEALERGAQAAVHNEARARFMATGLKMLVKGAIPARRLLEGAKEAAEAAVALKRIRDLKPEQHEVAEAQANKRVLELAPTDLPGAVRAQRSALLNNQLAKATMQAMTDVAKGLEYLKKFAKDSVRESLDLAFRDQIDALLARFDLRTSLTPQQAMQKRVQNLAAFVERIAALGFTPSIPERFLRDIERTHYKDLSVEDFRGLIGAIKSLEKLGRAVQRVTDGEESRLLADVAAEAKAQAASLPQRAAETNRGLRGIAATWLKAKRAGRSFAASLLKVEQMCDWLDDRNPLGIFNRMVFRKIADAEGARNDLDLRISQRVSAFVAGVSEDLLANARTIYTVPGVIDALTGKPQQLTWSEKMALAGMRGDAGAFGKLIKGEDWDADAVTRFLDEHMSAEEWAFVRGLAEQFQDVYELKKAMLRDLGDTSPQDVDRIAFPTRHGEMPGWYWPIKYDPARSYSVAERAAREVQSVLENNFFERVDTSTGREMTRNEHYAKPMLLSLDTVPRVLKDEIRDVTTRKALLEAERFLSHPDVREGISGALSPEHYQAFREWLLSLANDAHVDAKDLQFWDRMFHELRTRATMVGLGFRLTTMVMHGATAAGESVAEAGFGTMGKGIFNKKTLAALSTIGPEWMRKGVESFARSAQFAANQAFIFERSAEMRHRANEFERDVRDKLREIQLRMMDPATSSLTRAKLAIESRAYAGIGMLDMASALPTWMGAYLKGISPVEQGGLGYSEQDAVYFADKTLRNAHGGGGIKDMAAVQRGSETWKAFTMFYTFWNHNVTRLVDTGRRWKTLPRDYAKAKAQGNLAAFRGDVGNLVLRTFMYTLGVQYVHHMLHPPKDDEGSEGWLAWFGRQMALSAFGGVPVARDMVGHFFGGKDYELSPIASLVDNTDRLLADMKDGAVHDRWIKHAMTEAGYILNLPLGQIGSTTQFLSDVWTGEQDPQDIADWWRGIVHGDMRETD